MIIVGAVEMLEIESSLSRVSERKVIDTFHQSLTHSRRMSRVRRIAWQRKYSRVMTLERNERGSVRVPRYVHREDQRGSAERVAAITCLNLFEPCCKKRNEFRNETALQHFTHFSGRFFLSLKRKLESPARRVRFLSDIQIRLEIQM